MSYTCPRCGSENVQKLSLAHGSGTMGISATTLSTGIGRGHGGIGIAATQGEAQSLLAKRFAPPKAESAAGQVGCLAVLGFTVAVGVGTALNSVVAFWIVIGLTAALGIAFARQAAAHNAEQLPKAKALWDRRFICLRCEEVFEPRTGSGPGTLQTAQPNARAQASVEGGAAIIATDRYSVRLLSGGSRPLAATKIVRDILGLRIPEAKSLVETAPQIIRSGLSLVEAEAIKAQFEAIGASADIVGTPSLAAASEAPAALEEGRDEGRDEGLTSEPPPVTRRCPDCGRPIHGLGQRCTHCQAEEDTDRAVPAWLWACVAFLVIAGAATYLSSTKSAPTATQVVAKPVINTAAAAPKAASPVRPLVARIAIETGLLGPLEISGTTNLPDGTILPIWLEEDGPACTPNCGSPMKQATVRGGHFQTTVEGKDPLPGRYTVHVTTAETSAQPPNVGAAFGPSGQNLRGRYIVTLTNIGRTYEPVNPETEDASNYLSGFLVHYAQRIEIGEGGEVTVCPKRDTPDDCELPAQGSGAQSETPAEMP